jgi:hypothetical protein
MIRFLAGFVKALLNWGGQLDNAVLRRAAMGPAKLRMRSDYGSDRTDLGIGS